MSDLTKSTSNCRQGFRSVDDGALVWEDEENKHLGWQTRVEKRKLKDHNFLD